MRIKMKIINKTNWNTKDIRKVIKKVCEHEGFELPKIVEIYQRKSRVGGWGYIHRSHIKLNFYFRDKIVSENGKVEYVEPKEITGERLMRLGAIISHEITHTLGERDKDMIIKPKEEFEFLRNMVIRKQEKKKKQKKDIVKQRYEKVIKKVKLYRSKIKRYKTLLKKWEKKKKYYEKKYKNKLGVL